MTSLRTSLIDVYKRYIVERLKRLYVIKYTVYTVLMNTSYKIQQNIAKNVDTDLLNEFLSENKYLCWKTFFFLFCSRVLIFVRRNVLYDAF